MKHHKHKEHEKHAHHMHGSHHKHEGHSVHHAKHGHHAHSHHSHAMSAGTSEHPGHPIGHGDFANMPQHVMMHPYPKGKSGDEHLDDTIRRLDGDSVDAEKKIRKNMSKGMY